MSRLLDLFGESIAAAQRAVVRLDESRNGAEYWRRIAEAWKAQYYDLLDEIEDADPIEDEPGGYFETSPPADSLSDQFLSAARWNRLD